MAAPETAATPAATHPATISPEPLVIVDASNVAFSPVSKGEKASYKALCKVLDELVRARLPHVVIADASLRHKIDERLAYEGLVSRRVILQAPAGRSADQFIKLLAEQRGAKGQRVYVLSNDAMRQFPTLAAPRITYLALSDSEFLFDPPLELVVREPRSGGDASGDALPAEHLMGSVEGHEWP